jgi:hypothetical protein
MTILHPNHDDRHPPQMPWTFPLIAGTALIAVLAMVLLERIVG